MNSVAFLLVFTIFPLFLLVLIIVAEEGMEESIKKTDKSIEGEPINMDDEDE